MQKLGQNTNEIIKYLNSEGYYITIKENNKKWRSLIDLFKRIIALNIELEGKFKDTVRILNEMNDSISMEMIKKEKRVI